jgi:2-keto-3-deoxy-L-rhamnonate aldolase RhmA
VTIETEASIENLDAILTVPELGFVFIGPLDLSVALGHPGELDHPMVQDAVETVRSAAVDAGVPVGGLGFGMDDVRRKATNGYQLLNLGTTTGALEQTITEVIAGHPAEVERYRGGEKKLLGFFMGQVMKATSGKANPQTARELLQEQLDG